MEKYVYEGPVMRFDVCIQARWAGSTYASSLSQAANNLAFRYKKENGFSPNTKITIPRSGLKRIDEER